MKNTNSIHKASTTIPDMAGAEELQLGFECKMFFGWRWMGSIGETMRASVCLVDDH